ncbi:nucleotide excision repair, TFIIH, subunit [Sporormia fimetaria CBS 119925]|uniref:General transcription and DNA repair factor IIH subunit TFB5 n=1 Tax=Sporormia fimetaria CBS 119925 TaxID=1340428 RepID=A0A6A6VJ78_9PLEO|nr:nucleotide excision repair, TFIIH, subunit [Sporormia fimetaria CBS 119925]
MVKAVPGALVKCDASIKAMLINIDNENRNDFIIEELDEEHLLVKKDKVAELKSRLHEMMKQVLREPDTDESDN